MAITIKAGSTDQSVYVFIQDSSVTTGAGLTGLAYNTASLTAYYVKERGTATAITLATLAAADSAHSDGGFKEVDATNMPGVYRLDLPDAAVSSGVETIVILKGATNMAPCAKEIALVAFNPQDSVRAGLTALPNAAADAAGGLPISDAGGLDVDAIKTKTDSLTFTVANKIDANIKYVNDVQVTGDGETGTEWGPV